MTKKPIFTAGALGDSITTAFNAHAASDNHDVSWSTGSASGFRSHVQRLQEAMPIYEVAAVNVAAAGARAAALPAQARQLATSKPDYATLLIGANDLTDWLMVGEYGGRLDGFRQDVANAVDHMIAANPRVMLLVSAIPDQARVVEIAMRNQGLGQMPWLDPSLIKAVRERYAERHRRANQTLEDIVKSRAANVRFAGAVAHFRFDQDHLSRLDSYHPSREGQAALAERAWLDGWF